jgi:hypothetical protein
LTRRPSNESSGECTLRLKPSLYSIEGGNADRLMVKLTTGFRRPTRTIGDAFDGPLLPLVLRKLQATEERHVGARFDAVSGAIGS